MPLIIDRTIVKCYSIFLCIYGVLQGAGTAIGELPPYFMARASRLSGEVDEEEQEIENLLQERRDHPSELVSCTDVS